MTTVLDINPKEAEKKLSTFRRYTTEILLVCALGAIGYLFQTMKELQKDFRDYLIKDGSNVSVQLDKSTSVLLDIKEILKDNQTLFKENNYLKQSKK